MIDTITLYYHSICSLTFLFYKKIIDFLYTSVLVERANNHLSHEKTVLTISRKENVLVRPVSHRSTWHLYYVCSYAIAQYWAALHSQGNLARCPPPILVKLKYVKKYTKKWDTCFFHRPKNGSRGWKLPLKFALENRFFFQYLEK